MQAEELPRRQQINGTEEGSRTCYEHLQLHPAAPLDLITASYWRLAGRLQSRRAVEPEAEADLHHLTRAYQTLTDSKLRAEYDASIGITEQALAPSVPRGRRGSSGRRRQFRVDPNIDYYDVLRVHTSADSVVIDEAYSTLRTFYVRLVLSDYCGPEVLEYLQEAYWVTSHPERRAQYDGLRERRPAPEPVRAPVSKPKPAKPARAAPKPRAAAKTTHVAVPVATPRPRRPSRLGALASAVSRQLTSMSQREQQQVDERLAQTEHVQVNPTEVEETLLRRISTTVSQGAELNGGVPVARLSVVNGPQAGTVFDIRGFPVAVGAGSDSDVVLPELGALQARLLFRDGRLVVYRPGAQAADAGSSESDPWHVLESGQEFALGPYTLLVTFSGS